MNNDIKAIRIRVIGIVQGVGFRPFIYRLATKLGIKGYVVNLGGSEVEIHVEGSVKHVNEFIDRISIEKPPNAKILNMFINEVEPKGYKNFTILKSVSTYIARSIIPPDIGICKDCVKEILDPTNRFYGYPWNSCAWCGPRFSMMYKTPYDRINTSMVVFNLCEECLKSYKDPNDTRRFHGQGISCKICGPKTYIYTCDGKKINVDDPIKFIANKILDGAIVSIKGVGGYHIACLASDNDVILKLRTRKKRDNQPFAIMARDLGIVEEIAIIPPRARELLESPQRPIVIVPKKNGSKVSDLVAPGLSTIGIMLPYTGFQILLLNEISDGFLVMTSGNVHGEPMCTNLNCVLSRLKDVVDYIVEHDRDIVHRVDDSVIRFTDGEPIFLRRGRGYAPEWIEISIDVPDIVALGGELQTAGGIAFEDKVILTQFIGDLDSIEVLEDLKREIRWFIEMYKLKPKAIAIDMHPQYHNRIIAKEFSEKFGAEIIEVQHHHAHAVSVLADHLINPDNNIIAITIDGTGYGIDGGIWGGEVLLTKYGEFKRIGSLKPFVLPGGDSAAIYTIKPLIAVMASLNLREDEVINVLKKLNLINILDYGYEEAMILYTLSKRGKGVITTSIGRILDAFAALLGICFKRTYEGEPQMKFEAVADKGNKLLDYEIKLYSMDNRFIVDTHDMFLWALENIEKYRREDITLTILKNLGRGLALTAIKAIKGLRNTEQYIVVGGGAAVNTYIIQGIREILANEDIRLLLPKKIPPGDGGIALGQILIASQVIDNE